MCLSTLWSTTTPPGGPHLPLCQTPIPLCWTPSPSARPPSPSARPPFPLHWDGWNGSTLHRKKQNGYTLMVRVGLLPPSFSCPSQIPIFSIFKFFLEVQLQMADGTTMDRGPFTGLTCLNVFAIFHHKYSQTENSQIQQIPIKLTLVLLALAVSLPPWGALRTRVVSHNWKNPSRDLPFQNGGCRHWILQLFETGNCVLLDCWSWKTERVVDSSKDNCCCHQPF